MTIRDFRQLRELELVTSRPRSPHRVIISSITSIELRKIIFPMRHTYNRMFFVQHVDLDWGLVDEQLCGLVDRLRATGYRHTLEVELQLTVAEGDPGDWDYTRFLPGFREKGAVTIVDAARDNLLLHSSTHTH